MENAFGTDCFKDDEIFDHIKAWIIDEVRDTAAYDADYNWNDDDICMATRRVMKRALSGRKDG